MSKTSGTGEDVDLTKVFTKSKKRFINEAERLACG